MSASVSDRHGSAHDPMCDDHHDGGDCPWCNFAARVREDERTSSRSLLANEKAYQSGYEHGLGVGRDAALRDAVEAVRLSPSADIELVERSQVITEIEALGGGQ